MVIHPRSAWIDELGLAGREPPEFFSSLSQIESVRAAGQTHSLRRAWQDLGLSGILCQDNTPLVYFKNLPDDRRETLTDLQRRFWNQGIAPLMAVLTPTEMLVLSGLALPARTGEGIDGGDRLVEVLTRAADSLELRNFLRSVETGEIFRARPRSFDPARRVDRYLLANLEAARRALSHLSSEISPRTVHALLTRVVFVCYLVDRLIIDESYFARRIGVAGVRDLRGLLDCSEGKNLLFLLFAQLKRDFNGDLFDANLDEEALEVRPEHLAIVRRFLRGDNINSSQLSLGFWAYDFGVIPIETISGIYERFLEAEDSSSRRKQGAFYTPRFLATAVLDMTLEGQDHLLSKRFLDPSCGSGIFLVALFHRIAEEWTRDHPGATNEERTDALIALLLHCIFGVDANEIACRISAFSLYLALLDQLSPRDIQALQERGTALPRLLVASHGGSNPGGVGGGLKGNIWHCDFFHLTPADLPAGGFDFIVGNPPWGAAKGDDDKIFEKWCANKDLPLSGRQIAQAFIWKARYHAKSEGRICFLLPASLLFNQSGKSRKVQRRWFETCRVERVVNLSDMRFYLFDGPVHPAIAVRFQASEPQAQDTFVYETPKTSWEMLRTETLMILPEDVSTITVATLLQELKAGESSTVLKKSFWGTPRDLDLLDRLRDFPTIGSREVRRSKQGRWVLQEGFNKGGKGQPRDREVLHELPFLPTAGVESLVIRRSALLNRPPTFAPRFLGSERIYRAPHVLFTHGGSRVGFADFDCSFEHSVRGLHAGEEERDQLRLLTCVLSSRLAEYFFFHTSASWGIEREKVHLKDYIAFPFPEPDTRARRELLGQIAVAHEDLEKISEEVDDLEERSSLLLQKIEPLIFAYYDLDAWEETLVADTVEAIIPSATPARGQAEIPLLRMVGPEERWRYLDLLVEALQVGRAANERRIRARVLLGGSAGLGVVCLRRVEGSAAPPAEHEAPAELDRLLWRISKLLRASMNGLSMLRNLKVFDGEDLYIVKPLTYRYWMRSTALNDADEIAAAILRGTC